MAGETRKPLDKILCGGKFYRYVVACMHNCPNPHYCNEFWAFFDAKALTPAEYYNEGGIGEKVMRRVVFDCDRCGKKDIGEMFGLYTDAGQMPEDRLPEARRGEVILQFGYASQDVNRLCGSVLESLESAKGWQHYCGKCFQKVVDGVATILGEPRKVASKASKDNGESREEYPLPDLSEYETMDDPDQPPLPPPEDEVAILEPVRPRPAPAPEAAAPAPVAPEPAPQPKRITIEAAPASVELPAPVAAPEAAPEPGPAASAAPEEPSTQPDPEAPSTGEEPPPEKGRRGRKPKPIALL